MSVEVVTFGCRLNAAESEVIRREAERAGLSDTVVVNTCAVTAEAVRQARQTIRALRRERPSAKIVVTGCAAQTEPQTFAPWPKPIASSATRKAQRASVGAHRAPISASPTRRRRWSTTSWRSSETAAASDRGVRRPRARLRAGAERLRPPLHVLHHPLRPRQFALGADGRGRRRRAAARRQRLLRGRAHRRRHHQLRRRPARRAEARHAGQADPQARAGAQAAAPVVDRLDRGRSATCIDAFAQRSPADAASASVAAGRRRPDPQAHEAPASREPTRSRSATTVRRLRPDVVFGADLIAGFPTETEAMFRRSLDLVERMRPDAPACVSVLAAAGHAGGAHAAARPSRS